VARAVLIVDDDERLRSALGEMIADDGYPVLLAQDGAAALAILREPHDIGVVLLDMQMPVMSGDAFLLARSADRKLRAIPVCIVSADPDAHAKAVGLGVSCMLRKPFLIDELFQVIAAFCDPRER
jgi:CheY-like chemotaxis protein